LKLDPDRQPLVPPVSRYFANAHESLFASCVGEERIGAIAREGLSKASALIGREIAGAEVFRGAIEPVAGMAVLKFVPTGRNWEVNGLLGSTDSPNTT
jgi:hypothetical protein